MAKRKENLILQVVDLPWWVGIVFAILVYVFLRFIVPAGTSSSVNLRPMGQAVSQSAWLFSLLFVVVAIGSAVRSYLRKHLLDSQVSLDSIRALPWQRFEHLVGEAFRRQGYRVEERGGSAPDGGIDLVLLRDGKKTVVQCKHWRAMQVGVKPIRELYGVMTAEGANEAIFVSSGDYTSEARAFADGQPIQLIDGDALLSMVRSVQQGPITHHPSLITETADVAPSCPKCARPMVKRMARSGRGAGGEFWGCSAYPQCKGRRSLN